MKNITLQFKEFINSPLVYLYMASLISADTILTKEDADTSRQKLEEFKESLDAVTSEELGITDDHKQEFYDFIEKAFNILEQDYPNLPSKAELGIDEETTEGISEETTGEINIDKQQ